MTDNLPTLPEVISSIEENAISIATSTLDRGGLVAFPTDTVYGLAARIDQPEAINRLFIAKGRDFNKAIAVLIGRLDHLEQVAEELSRAALILTEKFWPGALTVVVTRKSSLPAILSPYPTVGVRMPDHAFARNLLAETGPLATTSANLSGGPNPITAADVFAQLEGRIDLLIDGGPTPGGVPSTLVDCTVSPVQILRHGAITDEAIFQVLVEK
jgi:L-threonylcarbamoyladenylate synthase